MRWLLVVAAMMACAACQPAPEGSQVAALPYQTEQGCHDFTTPVTTGGRSEQARGEACEQPDGSWQVVQNTPGLPAQAYVLEPPGQPAATASTPVPLEPTQRPATQPPANQPACGSYTVPVTVGEQPRQAVITGCPQPDGSWKITQTTPGLPTQVYQVPPPASTPYPYDHPYPVDYAYPEFFPYWGGAPWYFGLAPSIVVVQRFRHFQHGFPRGFAHGFGRGFGPGFGHHFAAARGGGGGGRR
jgi:surface antigen